MSNFNRACEKRLLEMLNEELGLFEQMKAETLKQTKLLDEDDMDAFNESLEKREILKEKINGLHQEKDPLMQSYLSSSATIGQASKKMIDTLRDKIRLIVTESLEINNANIAAAGSKIEEYSERIKQIDTSKKTFDAYTTAIPDNSEHFDKTT
jgi:hypothetical protein